MESAAHLLSALNSVPTQVAVLDHDGSIVQVNDAWKRFARQNGGSESTAEWVGVNYLEVCRRASGPSAEEAAGARQGILDVLSGRRETFALEYPCHSPAEQRWFSMSVTPHLGAEGRVVVSHFDITERKLAERVLQRTKDELQQIVEERAAEYRAREKHIELVLNSTAEGILEVDLEGHCTFCNAAGAVLLGFDEPGALIGKDLHREIHHSNSDGSHYPKEACRIHQACRDGLQTHVTNEVFWRADGTSFPVEYRSRPLLVPDPIGHVVTFTDMTDRKRFEDKMLHTQKLESLGVLAGGIAHDFNNLLTSILGSASLVLAELPPESPIRPDLERIKTGSIRASELSKQMLAYSGRAHFQVEALDLSALVKEMSNLLEVSVSKKAVIRYDLKPDLPLVEADGTQVRQVVLNLITNASEAIGDKEGVISISTGVVDADRSFLSETYLDDDLREGRYVNIEVSDTGVGIDEETMKKVFDPFFTTKFTGRGLGLAAVLGIVRGHRGALKVQSEPGRGSTFNFLLPCSQKPVSKPAAKTPNPVGWRGEGTVLVVDDEHTVRAVSERMLSGCGLQVLSASDGREAVEIYRRRLDEIDAVLLDLTMPNLDGEATFRELRRLNANVSVVMMSGYNEMEVTKRFPGKVAAGFIQKPFTASQLAGKIKEALEKHRKP